MHSAVCGSHSLGLGMAFHTELDEAGWGLDLFPHLLSSD